MSREVLLTGKVNTYKIDNNEILRLEKLHRQKIKNGSNIFKTDKEYRKYSAYKRYNYKKIMSRYNSSKARDKEKQGLVKLSKEQFVEKFKRDKLNKIN